MKGRHIFWLTIWWTLQIVVVDWRIGLYGITDAFFTFLAIHSVGTLFYLIVVTEPGVENERETLNKPQHQLFSVFIGGLYLIRGINKLADRIW